MDKPEFTPEFINDFFEERKRQMDEIQRLGKKAKEYKKRTKANNLILNIEWEVDLTNIDLRVLQTGISTEILNDFPSNFELITLNLDWVVSKNCEKPDKIYPKNNLWTNIRQPHNIARLVEIVENNYKIIPPMIRPVANNQISIMDGHHRIALCRFLKIEMMPFLIEKNYKHLLVDMN